MQKAEFDKFATEYYALHDKNIRHSGESPEFFAEYKVFDILELLTKQGKQPKNILDFGSGIGTSVPYFHKFFPNSALTCLDISEKSLEIGKSRFSDLAEFTSFDGKHLPTSDNTFDLAFAACVFHHIPHEEHHALLQEWHRVLKPGGTAVIFEHNPLNPLTVHAVNTCPFDENAKLIKGKAFKSRLQDAGFQNIELRYRLFFPGSLKALRPLERRLYNCPLGAQYFVYATKA